MIVIRRHGEHHAMFQIQWHLVRVSVLTNQRVKGVAIRHPSNQTAVRGERDDGIASDAQVSLCRGHGRVQQRVHQTEELHHAFVLAQIFMTFQEVTIVFTIGSMNLQSSRSLLGRDHVHSRREGSNLGLFHLSRYIVAGNAQL